MTAPPRIVRAEERAASPPPPADRPRQCRGGLQVDRNTLLPHPPPAALTPYPSPINGRGASRPCAWQTTTTWGEGQPDPLYYAPQNWWPSDCKDEALGRKHRLWSGTGGCEAQAWRSPLAAFGEVRQCTSFRHCS